MDRLIALIMILLEHEQISARELAERLEVSRRTIYRDIDTLNRAGLPIYTLMGAWGGVGLMKSYKVGKTVFTPQEIQNLQNGMQSYKQLFGRREMVYAAEKLNALYPDNAEGRPNAPFVMDLSLNQGNESLRSLFGMIETAMNEHAVLTFAYTDARGQISERRVEPYQVVFKESSWYLQAYCLIKQDYRIFKLARMSGLQVTKEQFAPKEFTPLPMDGSDWLNQGWVEVTIRLDRSVMDRVIERFGADHILRVDEHHCWTKYPIIANDHGYDRLLAFGDKCEVLGPPEIRSGFKAYVRGIMSKYEGDNDVDW
ncbi:DeoR family transcriptional regulator [Paenibacillus sp. FSL R7-269]|uniref:helix-turn-helix transcriptional regulator n=1 Tax=Paenibacillus sp. FSL R7-269 TaxID=1226755 RepID=UPI0003E244AA|nr:YafY family protein [Paenibacillus sp. FSL R7-269]ETT33952.1 DeoR family transcriptional regulator [Paenibacillus sp. FSL R7-269]